MSIYRETLQSEKFYGRVAPRYDAIFERAILSERRLTQLTRQYMDGRRVLDLACGNGRWLDRFAPREYVGLDLNAPMIAEARRRYPAARRSHTRFILGDMTALPFPDASFEGVMSMFGAMGHLPPEGQERMFREVHRVLAPGGVAIFTNGNLWSPFALPVTLSGSRVRLEGVRFKVHSTTPRRFRRQLAGFEILALESYDYSYLPIAPIKLTACLLGRDYREWYGGLMGVLDNCRHIPTLRWFGKQLTAVCKRADFN